MTFEHAPRSRSLVAQQSIYGFFFSPKANAAEAAWDHYAEAAEASCSSVSVQVLGWAEVAAARSH